MAGHIRGAAHGLLGFRKRLLRQIFCQGLIGFLRVLESDGLLGQSHQRPNRFGVWRAQCNRLAACHDRFLIALEIFQSVEPQQRPWPLAWIGAHGNLGVGRRIRKLSIRELLVSKLGNGEGPAVFGGGGNF